MIDDSLSLEEGDVDDGGVEVDELEDEHFECEIVVVLLLGAVHLPVVQFLSHVFVHLTKEAKLITSLDPEVEEEFL